MIEIALYQPDIAPNAATIMRMAACFGLRVRIIEPAVNQPFHHLLKEDSFVRSRSL